MQLLVNHDENLSRVISRALLHFLQIENIEEQQKYMEKISEIDSNARGGSSGSLA